jgi:hypothetical protein
MIHPSLVANSYHTAYPRKLARSEYFSERSLRADTWL